MFSLIVCLSLSLPISLSLSSVVIVSNENEIIFVKDGIKCLHLKCKHFIFTTKFIHIGEQCATNENPWTKTLVNEQHSVISKYVLDTSLSLFEMRRVVKRLEEGNKLIRRENANDWKVVVCCKEDDQNSRGEMWQFF